MPTHSHACLLYLLLFLNWMFDEVVDLRERTGSRYHVVWANFMNDSEKMTKKRTTFSFHFGNKFKPKMSKKNIYIYLCIIYVYISYNKFHGTKDQNSFALSRISWYYATCFPFYCMTIIIKLMSGMVESTRTFFFLYRVTYLTAFLEVYWTWKTHFLYCKSLTPYNVDPSWILYVRVINKIKIALSQSKF